MTYRTIVADPPWEIAARMGAGGRRRRSTTVPYSFMSVEQIAALPIGDLASDECHLYLWATRRIFREGDAVRVARAWGFEPKGELIWGLRNPGMGGFCGNGHEPVLLASRGGLTWPPDALPGGGPVLEAAVRHERRQVTQRQARGVSRPRRATVSGPASRAVRSPTAARLGHVGQRSNLPRRHGRRSVSITADCRTLIDEYDRRDTTRAPGWGNTPRWPNTKWCDAAAVILRRIAEAGIEIESIDGLIFFDPKARPIP